MWNFTAFVLLFLPSISFASFSLSSIQSIECSDRSGNPKLFFSTTNKAARKYTRRPDTIPYDYGSSRSAMSGQMKLNNDSDADGGVISLVDAWDPEHPSTLVLMPLNSRRQWLGYLSGQVETADGWSEVREHEMDCIVQETEGQLSPFVSTQK